MKLATLLTRERIRIEKLLDKALPTEAPISAALGNDTFNDALRHAVKAGGKRVRPILTLLCAKACSATPKQIKDAEHAAVAIELLHSYTLVHDDLPAMDNDTLRRGEPTVWAKYGEGTAILVGDFLQALAFEQLIPCQTSAQLLPILTRAATLVIRGQVSDIAAAQVDAATWSAPLLDYVFTNKTAMLIASACQLGAVAAGATKKIQTALFNYGLNVGLAFQYIDDLLDAQQSQTGNELSAIVLHHGDLASVKDVAIDCTQRALDALNPLPGDTTHLATFAQSLISRVI